MTKKMQMEYKQANAIAQAFLTKTKYHTSDQPKIPSPDEKSHDKPPEMATILEVDDKAVAARNHEAMLRTNQ